MEYLARRIRGEGEVKAGRIMPSYSKASQERLDSCCPEIREIFEEVIKHYDNSVITGHRQKHEQDEAFRTNKSKVQWPNSKHNHVPSEGIDAAPYPIDWKDRERFSHFAGFVQATARSMGHKLRWGGDWDGDRDLKDNTFDDLVHFEIVR